MGQRYRTSKGRQWNAFLRRTKAALIYKHRQFGAVQILLGHSKIETTVRYLGIEVEELTLAETTEV